MISNELDFIIFKHTRGVKTLVKSMRMAQNGCIYLKNCLKHIANSILFRLAMLAQHLPDFCQYMSHFLLVIANYLFEFFITLFKDCKYDNLLTVMVTKKLFTKKFSIMAFPLIIGDDLWRILQHCSVCFDWLSMRLKNILSFLTFC